MAKSVDVRGRADRMATARRGVYRPTAAGLQKVTSGTSGAASALITRGGTCEINREYGSTGVYARTRIFGVSKRAATLRACAVFLRRLTSRTTKKLADLTHSLPPCEILGTRYARTRIFGVSKRAATLRACAVFLRRLMSRTTKKLADLTYSLPPCEILGTRYARTRIFGVSKRAATLRACAVFVRRLTSRTTKKLAGLPYSRTPCEISGTRHIGPGSAWPENVPSRWRANSATWKRHGSFCDSSCSVAAQRCDESFEPRCIGRDGDRVDDSRAAAVRPTATA
jgi:hypothetical protein